MCQVALALIPRDAIEGGGAVVSSQLAAQPDDPCIDHDHALFPCVGHPFNKETGHINVLDLEWWL